MGNALTLTNKQEALLLASQEGGKFDFSVAPPFQNAILLCEDIVVAGTTHVGNIDAIVEELRFPVGAQLVRDVGNMHDEWAIKVLVGQVRIGFVPAACNELLARLMDGGKKLEAKLTAAEKRGSWNKIHMEVSLID